MKRVIVVTAAGLTLLGACSSSGTKKPAAAPTTATSSARSATTSTAGAGAATPSTIAGSTTTGVTPTEIKVGAILYKAFFADAAVGFNARIKRQNDAGGIYGRKVVLDTVIDDGELADQDLTAAKTLVLQDGVFAVAPVMTAAFAGASYLNDARVPFFGWSIEPRWCGLMWGFGFGGNDCDQATLKQVGDFPKAAAKLFPDGQVQGKAVALMSEDNTSASAAVGDFAKIWQHDGAKVVLVDTSVPTPPAVVGDYTPFAQKIMTSNNGGPPDYVQVVFATSDTIGLYKKLVQLGYKGIVQGFSNYDPRLLGGTKGLVSSIQMAPFEDAAIVPEVQQMVTDLKAYKPDVTLGQPAAAGYWTADFLVKALEKAGPNLSREALYNAINGGFTYAAGGALAPVTWPDGHQAITGAAVYVQDEGDHFAVPVHLTPLQLIDNPGYTGK